MAKKNKTLYSNMPQWSSVCVLGVGGGGGWNNHWEGALIR